MILGGTPGIETALTRMLFFVIAIGIDFCMRDPKDVCAANLSVAEFSVNIDCFISTQCKCLYYQTTIKQLTEIVPFLYPFSIEFNILVGKKNCCFLSTVEPHNSVQVGCPEILLRGFPLFCEFLIY